LIRWISEMIGNGAYCARTIFVCVDAPYDRHESDQYLPGESHM
jgi:hypothetical protein